MIAAVVALALAPEAPITWTKTVLDPKFRAEACAVADVNRDGSLDVLVGDLWYDLRSKQATEIRPVGDFGDGLTTYSNAFAVFAMDVNRDGWMDQVTVGMPGTEAKWYENPKGRPGHWKERVAWASACNESPMAADLFRDGRPVLVMGAQPPGQENMGQMIWAEPGADLDAKWTIHPISEPSRPGFEVPGTHRYSHGLGVGDMNGDRRLDVIVSAGWWEQPKEGRRATQPWKFHPANFGGPSAQLFAIDLDGDRQPEVLGSSAHDYGIWSANSSGVQMLFPRLVSSSHALWAGDLDGDRVPDMVTGKRFWAHGWNDPGAREPSRLHFLRGIRARNGQVVFEPLTIDEDSGVGTGFAVADMNRDRRLDIVIANKKGVFVFTQGRGR